MIRTAMASVAILALTACATAHDMVSAAVPAPVQSADSYFIKGHDAVAARAAAPRRIFFMGFPFD